MALPTDPVHRHAEQPEAQKKGPLRVLLIFLFAVAIHPITLALAIGLVLWLLGVIRW
jgi:hypothetical protein